MNIKVGNYIKHMSARDRFLIKGITMYRLYNCLLHSEFYKLHKALDIQLQSKAMISVECAFTHQGCFFWHNSGCAGLAGGLRFGPITFSAPFWTMLWGGSLCHISAAFKEGGLAAPGGHVGLVPKSLCWGCKSTTMACLLVCPVSFLLWYVRTLIRWVVFFPTIWQHCLIQC